MDAKTMTMPNGDIINLMDEEARNLLGDETLDTTAQTCTGAINELKGTLDSITEDIHTKWKVIKSNKICDFIVTGNVTLNADGYTFSETISAGYRPRQGIKQCSKVYNGSSYVDCVIEITTLGTVTIRSLNGQAISGVNTDYLATNQICYIVA